MREKHLFYLIERRRKQIRLPRLRDRDDMHGGFFSGPSWSPGPACQGEEKSEAGMKAGMCKKTKQDLGISFPIKVCRPCNSKAELLAGSNFYMLAFWDDWESWVLCESFPDRC